MTPNTTALLLEYGYIDNPNDVRKLQANLRNYVEAVVKAVANYAGVPYTAPNQQGRDTYTVVSGDSLWSIANRFNTTVDELKRLNNLTTNTLQIGQILLLPTITTNTPGDMTSYTVQAGDSLWSIANRFNTTVDALRNMNNLTSDFLYVGQVLQLPTSENTTSSTYTVKAGDTLWELAQRYNTSVNTLKQLNNLTSDLLQVGQILQVPASQQNQATFTYTVQPGDSLYKIANRFDVSIQDIINLNQLPTTVLQVGQTLQIPNV